MARCQLCDGQIVNGRCLDCGMDYSRMAEHQYHLNLDCDDYDPKARKTNAAYEKSLLGKGEKSSEGRKTVLNGAASVKPNKAVHRSNEPQQKRASTERQRQIQQEQAAWAKEKMAKPEKKKSGLQGVIWFVVVLILYYIFLMR